MDAWGSPLPELLPLIDIFLPNEGELCRMAGGCGLDEAILSIGKKVPLLVVKRGRKGCRVMERGEIFDVAGLAVSPVDTIGAGDSFDAGFLYAYLQGKSTAACARAGNITGALSTLGTGGTGAFLDIALRDAFLEDHGFFLL